MNCTASPGCLGWKRAPGKSPVRFFRDAPKIYEMCLHVPLCKRACRGGIARIEKAGGTHAFSRWESTLFQNNWRWLCFFFSHLLLTHRHSVGLCFRRISFLFSCLFSFFCHHSARQAERRTARTVGALPSARICFGRCELNGPMFANMLIHGRGGWKGGGMERGESYFVEVCWKLGCHLHIGSS